MPFNLIFAVALLLILLALGLRSYARRKFRCCHRAEHTFWICSACGGGLCDFHTSHTMHRSGQKVKICPSCKTRIAETTDMR